MSGSFGRSRGWYLTSSDGLRVRLNVSWSRHCDKSRGFPGPSIVSNVPLQSAPESYTLTPFTTGIATYLLLWPSDGIMKKEDVRSIYDGSIFFKRAEETKRKRAHAAHQKHQTSPGLVEKAKKLL